MQAWYVAKTKPTKERWVETYLTEKLDVEVFLPIIRRPASHRGGWEPLFPTYLFCHLDPHCADWEAIRWAPGVAYFLGAGEGIIPVGDDVVAHLQRRVSWWNDREFTPGFNRGDRLIITSGPFAGLEAIFQSYVPARRRCQVLLEIVGRTSKVELPVEVLKAGGDYRGLALAGCSSVSA
ncbi:MAG: hypothetical protein HYX90_09540 [Chloroflexi bacterium]|nr:hypothetical protein [Chloroflexota bacterium]